MQKLNKIAPLTLFLGIMIVFNHCYFSTPETFKKSIQKKNSYQKISDRESYEKDCSLEMKQNIHFPTDKTEYAVIHFSNIFKFSHNLNFNQTQKILTILNDTSNYEWGEIGTPTFERYITFYNSKNECIGLTMLSSDHQTYSTPHIARMKWGFLSSKGFESINKILSSL